jgi:hypothetical protein
VRTLLGVVALPFAALAACSPAGESLEPWVDPGTSEAFLGYDVMPEVELRLDDDAIAALERAPRIYVEGTILYQGGEYGPVGVRLKGQNSFLPIGEKPSLKVNVNEYIPDATFWGLKDLTFNNMRSDPSMMHERLAYLVAREAGLPAPRCNHLLLTINGQPYGLYANVETVKERMIGGHFEDSDGSLFEATDVDFTAEHVDRYELESGPDDRRKLSGLAGALTQQPADLAMSGAAGFIDVDHLQRYWAMATIVGQFDAFPYSVPGDDYFIYDDPTSDRLWIVPWGMDETFLSAEFPPMQVHSVLAVACRDSPACRQGYVDRVWELLARTEAIGLDDRRVQALEQIAPHVAADTRRPYDDATVAEYQTQLRYFIRGRREILTSTFPPPSP